MARILSKWAVLSIGVAFHLAFLLSIFDIYFVSPLVHGMQHYPSANPNPAKRLFLIVGDGLRADKCFKPQVHPASQQEEVLAPYLMAKVTNMEAMSGISHTRMPTESRPGHVALIAGFYEDVSAVTKGWQTNPVNFDSVFNQSRHTWSFGSPDILPMFAIGADEGRVDATSYDHSFEDFTKSSIELDRFSFDHIDKLFESASRNETLNEMLHSDKIVFFLHLLGIDNAGHFKRPYSAEYYDNIKFVDSAVQAFEQRVAEFYKDDESAFVFTADHGMSDLGSHGDGHPDNTQTPLIVWGKGVRKSSAREVMRADVQQADVASLMTYLVGLNHPANSVGELPTQYLDASLEIKSRAVAANADAIAEQYLVKQRKTAAAQLNFRPFPALSGSLSPEHRREEIRKLLDEEHNWNRAIVLAEDLISQGLEGLRYLQQYNWQLLRTLVTLGFLGWIAFALTSFLHLFVANDVPVADNYMVTALFVGIAASLSGLLHIQHSPWNYHLYALFPSFFWYVVVSSGKIWSIGLARLLRGSQATSIKASPLQILGLCGGVALLEGIVRGYFHRELFSIMLLVVFIPWPFFTNWRLALSHWPTTLLWVASCIALAVFGTLPVNKIENLQLITGSGMVMAALTAIYNLYLIKQIRLTTVTMVTSGFQLSLILLAVIVTSISVKSLQADKGLPIGSQLMGWMTLLFSLLIPFMHSLSPVSDYRFRLLNVFALFSPTMIILTISYEGYFYVAFAGLLFAWLHLESLFAKSDAGPVVNKSLTLGSFRLALAFLFFTHIAFFATGNIASISSFSLDSVYRLVPIFNPFSMGALLILKILIPFVLLSVVLGIINLKVGLPKHALFSMVLAISDVLSLNFFYMVVDEGSWLDIGTGISHYCICSMLCLFLSLIEYLSTALVSGIEIE